MARCISGISVCSMGDAQRAIMRAVASDACGTTDASTGRGVGAAASAAAGDAGTKGEMQPRTAAVAASGMPGACAVRIICVAVATAGVAGEAHG